MYIYIYIEPAGIEIEIKDSKDQNIVYLLIVCDFEW